MSGIRYFKNKDYGDTESIWNAGNLKLKRGICLKELVQELQKVTKAEKNGKWDDSHFVYSAQVWKYQIFTNNSSFFLSCLASL